jgi:hypothetical protein
MLSLCRLGEFDDGLPARQLGWTPSCLDAPQRRQSCDLSRNPRARRHFDAKAHVPRTSRHCRVPALMIIHP